MPDGLRPLLEPGLKVHVIPGALEVADLASLCLDEVRPQALARCFS
jgi:hypothetical protein